VGRLRALRSRLASPPARLKSHVDASGHSTRDDSRAWYFTQRWKALRWASFVRDGFTCQWPTCGRLVVDTSQLVADHRQPHRGDPALFWDPRNLQTLCKPCHDTHKQRADRAPPGR
jgi:5-methylcytosine-specific restriction endonuclease McrA